MRKLLQIGFLATAAVLLLLTFPGRARAEDPARPEEELRLRDVDGVVREVVVFHGDDGEEWMDAVVAPGEGAPLRLRLAPAAVMTQSGFALKAGDRVRVRYFTQETPGPVQRIRNEATGRVLRLRCLHGRPLWPWMGDHQGPGHHGPPPGRGGMGHGPGGHSGPPS